MKRLAKTLVLPSVALLVACGGGESSSSSSFSSSEAPVLDCVQITGNGDVAFTVEVDIGGGATDVSLVFDDLSFNVLNDYPIEGLNDLVDYTYYTQAVMMGDMECASIRLTEKRGRSKTEYEFPTAKFYTYAKDGDIYLDFSDIDASDIGIEDTKYVFRDGFSFLNDEQFRDLGTLLAIPELDMQSLLVASTENEIIENAIHMERYDRERYQVSFDLTSDSLSQVVSYFSEETTAEQAKATIEENVLLGEGTVVTALYNMKDNSISGMGVRGSVGIPMDPIEYQGITIDLSKTRIELDLEFQWNPCGAFELPPLEGYKEYNSSDAPQDSSSSSQESTSVPEESGEEPSTESAAS